MSSSWLLIYSNLHDGTCLCSADLNYWPSANETDRKIAWHYARCGSFINWLTSACFQWMCFLGWQPYHWVKVVVTRSNAYLVVDAGLVMRFSPDSKFVRIVSSRMRQLLLRRTDDQPVVHLMLLRLVVYRRLLPQQRSNCCCWFCCCCCCRSFFFYRSDDVALRHTYWTQLQSVGLFAQPWTLLAASHLFYPMPSGIFFFVSGQETENCVQQQLRRTYSTHPLRQQ